VSLDERERILSQRENAIELRLKLLEQREELLKQNESKLQKRTNARKISESSTQVSEKSPVLSQPTLLPKLKCSPIEGIEIYDKLSEGDIKILCDELSKTNVPWGWPKFNSGGTYYVDRPSIVIGLGDEVKFYGYSNAITYDVIPSSEAPEISRMMISLSEQLHLQPNTCQIVLYLSENVDFPYHTDQPLEEDTGFFVIRLGYSRVIEFEEKGSINIKEGEIYVVRPRATNILHRVPTVNEQKKKRNNATRKPVLQASSRPTNKHSDCLSNDSLTEQIQV